ncbi:hypothetical protein BDP27DRAFT_1544413 [Rhodocollybia butyracea]|uniref:F-box domain-containing protein n=1 Tax=Rhodocollybia butyracea TaxID=206335 RepID=A0A9P5PPV4_9AGAR|nr:hypothetical protein BDP27DRAFT_1544413 [Rhodocollybia butyracea]
MTLPCTGHANSLHIRVDLSSTELSELERRLRSEFGPFVVDSKRAEGLKEMLAMADKDIEDCDSEVARLYDRISTVQAEKQRLEKQRTKLWALLSPIRRLPNELLLLIFQFVCQQTPNRIEPCFVISHLPTMAISSVCSRWRELALLSPSLWANLDVQVSYRNMAVSTAVARYLERSRDCPLTLKLVVTAAKTGIPAITSLTQHVHRWKTFEYWGQKSLTEHNILSNEHFHSLEKLAIDQDVDLGLFEHCPKLRVFTTPSVPGPIPKPMYNQLDHLDFHARPVRELAEYLCTWPSLKSLKLGGISNPDVEDEAPDTWPSFLESLEFGCVAEAEDGTLGTWSNITSLTLGDGPTSDIVLSHFNFPSLNDLAMVYLTHAVWAADGFTSFLSRSSCMITTFTLYDVVMSDSELIEVLRVLPSLLHLKIRHSDLSYFDIYIRKLPGSEVPITSHLISSLIHQSPSICLVPKLHSLYLESDSTSIAFDNSVFVGMVQSRWFKPGSTLSVEMLAHGRASIRSVVLKLTSRELNAETYKPLRVLDAEGLRVVVTGKNGVMV